MKFNLRTIFLLLVAAAAAFAAMRNLREDGLQQDAEQSRIAVMSLKAMLANKPGMVEGTGNLESGDPNAVRAIRRWMDDGVPAHEFPREWDHHMPYVTD